VAQDEPLQAYSGNRVLVLSPKPGGATLALGDGREVEIPLPDRAFVSTLQALSRGWIAAGDAPDGSGRRHLLVRRGAGVKVQTLPEPSESTSGAAGERISPVALVDAGRLVGLAWLEGDAPRGLAVRSAAWDGSAWSAPVWVSRRGPGSQVALRGVVLKDGSWLLAWSAYDGEDDEVVWSRRTSGVWSPAERISAPNTIPDVTPALVATRDGGAWIAWNRFESAGYRLLTARFEKGEWRHERTLAPAGSLYPKFLEDLGGNPALVYLQVQPRAWSLLTFDGTGRIEKRASVASSEERPAVTFEADGYVRLRWPAAAREARAILTTVERVP
jgi:hypothetical protein